MKIEIGPYLNYWGPYQIVDLLFFWHDKYPSKELEQRWDYVLHDKFADWLADTKLTDLCQWIYNRRKRKVKIHIDNYDVWNMDATLALIILPMLKLLKEKKHGSPFVDDNDVPDNLGIRSTDVIRKETDSEYDWDDNIHARWNWVLDEMLYTFESMLREEEFYRDGIFDSERFKEYNARIDRGLLLFGKYYRGLWD